MSTVSLRAREATAAPPTAARAASDRAELLALSACLVLALALRLPGLGSGLWYDEIETLVEYVRRPLALILGTFDSKNQHLLYSVAAHLSVSALGESAATLRLPAVLFGVASVLAFHRFARAVVGRDEALIGAAALAVSYHHVWFSQNARGYTGLRLFTLLATQVLWRLLSGGPARRLDPLWYGVWLALAVYTHFTAVLVGVAHALIVGGVALVRRARGVELGTGRALLALGRPSCWACCSTRRCCLA
ncbi:MAG: glycosyltransferase family 39 protein [Gemmatimonadales bacterium]